MMVVLLGPARADFALGSDHVDELSKLGVTNVSLLRDERMVGIVLEGWLFDPARSSHAAVEAIGAPGARTLHPILQMTVSNDRLANGGE
jgi:hypothetical protein